MSDHQELLEHMAEDIRDIRAGIRAVQVGLSSFKVEVEHRLTTVETKTKLFGTLGGFVAGLVARFLWR